MPAPDEGLQSIGDVQGGPHDNVVHPTVATEPQLSPIGQPVGHMVFTHLPELLQVSGDAHPGPHLTMAHPSDAMPHTALPHGLGLGVHAHDPLPLQCSGDTHACSHEPQFWSSLLKFTHAPLHALGVPPEQESVHELLLHKATPVEPPELGPGQDLHVPPPVPVPHSDTDWPVVTHPLPSQHPAPHDDRLQAPHMPLWQICPLPHV
ncbi:MAG: hypothetical protein M3O50_14685 [Myxococcota bacterium]|nr:hypothetical protein [Myxococcota bacterium]